MIIRCVQLLQRNHQFARVAFKLSQRHDQNICIPQHHHQEWSRLMNKLFLNIRCSSSGNGNNSKDKSVTGKAITDFKTVESKSSTEDGTTSDTIQTKSFEVKTSKGILSITTTIEDSKINEIVLEKSELAPMAKLIEPASASSALSKMAATTGQTSGGSELDMPVLRPGITPVEPVNSSQQNEPTSSSTLLTESGTASISSTTLPVGVAISTKRPRFDYRASLERNFITPARAITDFMLTIADLDSLPKIKRRSPYEQEPPMTVYWRRDVEAKALEVWGTRENLLRERLKVEVERKQHQQNLFTVKRRLRDYRREMGSRTNVLLEDRKASEKSGQVVGTAIAINAANLLFKVGGWLYSGSHSMFAECIHSLADLANQLILAFGIYKSSQMPDMHHPYGYMNMRYVSSLISGVGIFCVGCGLSIYHGIEGILHPQPIGDLFWVYCILMGSLVSEGATLMVAINELKRSAIEQNMTFRDYVISGKDPCVNVVLCEDAAAVTGVVIAGVCMGLSSYTGSPVYDSVGSLIIGGLLGGVASFIIYTNANALVGVSIPSERLEKINSALEADVMIRAIYDVKGIDIGMARVRYKAELDFDGRELTRSYLDKQDLNKLLSTVRNFNSTDELETFLLDQGEKIVDLMGGEIDRIEMNLRANFPEIRHVDLEIL